MNLTLSPVETRICGDLAFVAQNSDLFTFCFSNLGIPFLGNSHQKGQVSGSFVPASRTLTGKKRATKPPFLRFFQEEFSREGLTALSSELLNERQKAGGVMDDLGKKGAQCFFMLAPPIVPSSFTNFLGEGSRTKIDYRKKGSLILTFYWRT